MTTFLHRVVIWTKWILCNQPIMFVSTKPITEPKYQSPGGMELTLVLCYWAQMSQPYYLIKAG